MKKIYGTLVRIILVIVFVALAKHIFDRYIVPSSLIPDWFRVFYTEYIAAIDAVIIFVIGILVIQMISATVKYATRNLSREAQYVISNTIIVISYVILGVILIMRIGVGLEALVASAAFSGLVLGFSLGPILSNFFSGLIILGTGYVKPGRYIKISSFSFPISLITAPAYKFFSRDITIPTLRGTVLEIGLLYTKIISVDGELVKIPNSMLLNNSIVAEDYEESKRVQIRYELPVTCDPKIVVNKIRENLDKSIGNNAYELFIEEQSDKNYYIVLLTSTAPPNIRIREYRSRLLQELINVHRNLLKNNVCQ
ncbi:MAG: mechanosensitive ion channel family protein [Candidatus Bathyarchaeia archaeon]